MQANFKWNRPAQVVYLISPQNKKSIFAKKKSLKSLSQKIKRVDNFWRCWNENLPRCKVFVRLAVEARKKIVLIIFCPKLWKNKRFFSLHISSRSAKILEKMFPCFWGNEKESQFLCFFDLRFQRIMVASLLELQHWTNDAWATSSKSFLHL